MELSILPGGGARLTCPRPTNHEILLWTLITFAVFVSCEFFGALACNSLSLFGDASAMSVDVLSYLCNLYAEYAKRNGRALSETSRFVLVVGIPLTSTLLLMCVTIYIITDAVKILRAPPKVDDVAVSYLYAFAMGNLIVDFFCVTLMYSRGNDVFDETAHITSCDPFLDSIVGSQDEEDASVFEHEERDLVDEGGDQAFVISFSGCSSRPSSSSSSFVPPYLPTLASNGNAKFLCCCFEVGASSAHRKNLNMLSAFTHIGGDTLRTMSVFCAAVYSSVSGIDGDICDAYAAIFVGATIIILVLPLLFNIVIACATFRVCGGSGPPHDLGYVTVDQSETSSLVRKVSSAAAASEKASTVATTTPSTTNSVAVRRNNASSGGMADPEEESK